jgi:hypothetical protein
MVIREALVGRYRGLTDRPPERDDETGRRRSRAHAHPFILTFQELGLITLSVLPEFFAVCRLTADAPAPAWAQAGAFTSITRTRDEVSVVCPQAAVPVDVQFEGGWRCLKVEGPFELNGTVGVLAALAVPLAEAGISIFVVSTYDTDYLLLQDAHLIQAIGVLERSGHRTQALPATFAEEEEPQA